MGNAYITQHHVCPMCQSKLVPGLERCTKCGFCLGCGGGNCG